MPPESNSGIEFKLFAPYNEDVALIGSWNNWQPTPMQKDDKGWWRVSVPLADGEYEYKFTLKSKSYFMLDQPVAVADPYGTQVTLDSDENSIARIKNGQRIITEYQWKHDDKPLPGNNSLVIYEMHVGDFSGGPGDEPGKNRRKGRFVDVLEKLDYLAALGVNAIEMMPTQEFPGERSWGYNLRSLFAVENSYGTPDELAQLIDELHARGMRFIMDVVFNHSESEAPLTKINFEYWYFKDDPNPPHLRWGPKFNYDHRDANLDVWPARQYVLDSVMFWIDTFHVDGFRFDSTQAINSYEFLGWLQDQIFLKIGGLKPFYTIAEHIPQDPTVTGADGPLDAAWHENYYNTLVDTVCGDLNIDRLVNVLDPRKDGFGGAFNVVNYLNNHDHDRIMWTLGERSKLFDAPAFRRNKMGVALLLTSPGIPMLWMGEEFAESAPKTVEYQPIDWALLQNQSNGDLMRYYSGLIHLRKNHPALHGDSFEVVMRDDVRCIFAFKRWDEAGGVVIVAVNLQDKFAGEFTVGGLEDGTWHEYVYNYDTGVQGGVLRDSLAESEVKVYIKR